MRSLVIVCALTSIATAEPTSLPVDAVFGGTVGDWTILEGEYRSGPKLYKQRRIGVIASSVQRGGLRIGWFHGDKDKEVFTRSDRFVGKVDATLLGLTTGPVKSLQAVPATCTFAASFPCTKVTYSGVNAAGTDEVTVVMHMAPSVRGTGIVDVEVRGAAGLLLAMRTVAYGSGSKAEWGQPSKQKLDVPADDLGTATGVGWGFSKVTKTPADPKHPVHTIGIGTIGVGKNVGGYGSIGGIGMKGRVAPFKGDTDKEAIRRSIRRHLPKIHACYDKALATKPKLEGRIDARFEIAPSGSVSSSTASGLDPDVATCVADVIKTIPFPKPKPPKAIVVNYPFSFKPEK
jgi:hypothetical protein